MIFALGCCVKGVVESNPSSLHHYKLVNNFSNSSEGILLTIEKAFSGPDVLQLLLSKSLVDIDEATTNRSRLDNNHSLERSDVCTY